MSLLDLSSGELTTAISMPVRTTQLPRRYGTVAGFGKAMCSVLVQVEGDDEPTEWHAEEWEPA